MINKYIILVAVCLLFCVGMTSVNAIFNNLPMAIMWGAISIFELVMFCIVVFDDVNVLTDETEGKE